MNNIDIFSNSHKVSVALLFLLCPMAAYSGFEGNGRGTRAIALANAYVAIADDPWGAFYNPAGLSRVADPRAAAFFSPAQFGMSELRTMSVSAALPLKFFSGSVTVDQFGSALYRESTLALAFGIHVNEWCSLGATGHLARLAIEGYGGTSRAIIDAGGIAVVTDDVRIGWCWKNITQTTIGEQSEQLPQSLNIGVCYEITEHTRLTIELEKDIRYPTIKKFGFEQQLLNALSVRLGLSDNPDKFSCGFGFKVAGLEFSYAGYSHAQLGWTHQVELSTSLSP